jgi:hypothetical protein
MKNFEKILAEAVRVEYEHHTGEVFIVFKVLDNKFKEDIKINWTKDIEYRIIDKHLIEK